jgi:hypothetical protein
MIIQFIWLTKAYKFIIMKIQHAKCDDREKNPLSAVTESRRLVQGGVRSGLLLTLERITEI